MKHDEMKQEPVAWRVRWPKMGGGYAWVMNDAPMMAEHGFVNEPLYTSPPQRQPLTDEQIEQLEQDTCAMDFPETVRAIEAAHSIKGEA